MVAGAVPKRVAVPGSKVEPGRRPGHLRHLVDAQAVPQPAVAEPDLFERAGSGRPRSPARQDQDDDGTDVSDGPAHRRLIRATLPRQEGQQPPARPAPDFTIRQPAAGRPNRFRPRHQRGGQPFPGQSFQLAGRPDAHRYAASGELAIPDRLAARQAARSRAQAIEMIAGDRSAATGTARADARTDARLSGGRQRQRHGKPCRQARAGCWCGQQAVDFVGHRPGGRRGGCAAGVDLSDRAARRERPGAGGEAGTAAGDAV